MSKSQLRKTAYEYIRGKMGKLHRFSSDADYPLTIPLNELMLLKESLADPSVVLVAAFKRLFRGTVTEAESDAHLVKPFRGKSNEGEMNSARRSHI